MDFSYIDLYYDIISKKNVIVLKEYFACFEKEILEFSNMNFKEREEYINEHKIKFRIIDDLQIFYYDSIKVATSLYRNICCFKNFDIKIKDCNSRHLVKLNFVKQNN